MDNDLPRMRTARMQLEAIISQSPYDGVPYRLAKEWKINSVHFSKLFNDNRLSDFLDAFLVKKGFLPPRPPKDPRPRVWMRTDNVDLAVATLMKHYSLIETIEAIDRHQADRFVCVRLGDLPEFQPQQEYDPIFPHFDANDHDQ